MATFRGIPRYSFPPKEYINKYILYAEIFWLFNISELCGIFIQYFRSLFKKIKSIDSKLFC